MAAGLANALTLLIVNTVARSPESATVWTFLSFMLALAAFVVMARLTTHRTNEAIENSLHQLKTRLIEKIEHTGLERLERIGAAEIRDRITENVVVISNSASQVGGILQSVSIFLFSGLYLAWVSLPVFLLLGLLQVGAVYFAWRGQQIIHYYLSEQAGTRLAFLDRLLDLLKGAKELRFNRQRSRAVLEDFEQTAIALQDVSSKTNLVFEGNMLSITTSLYFLLAVIVFVLPDLFSLPADKLSALVAAILFVWGSVQSGLSGSLSYSQASQALLQIQKLEQKLDSVGSERQELIAEHITWPVPFGRIEARGLEYEYSSADDDKGFHIGPIDLTIEPGELVFIVGGNGAGKSTFMKALTGLYPLTRGSLKVGGVEVQPDNVAAYREMITTIFSDFHLFSKLYGLLDVEPSAVRALLEQMELEHKTSFAAGHFTRRNLSTGQRKRLAMVVALLEDRPLLVLDEWAADQDPEFRKYFYEKLLQSLKQQGKTILAVSHDDRYFHCADRIVTLEYGRIRSIASSR